MFVQDAHRALLVLDELKDVGVMLALDDFGTGYSSLSYLKRFPVDVVKIDQTFVADLAADHSSRAIVSAIIELAHALEMAVVTEGVETAEQHHAVLTLGTEACQGFYFAPPMTAKSLDRLTESAVTAFDLRLPIGSSMSRAAST